MDETESVPEYADLADEIRIMTNEQLKGIREYLGNNPTLPTVLANGGDAAELASAQAIKAMYSADVAAAMASAGLRPDGSVEAMIAAVGCLVNTAFSVGVLSSEIEVKVAKANIELARSKTELEKAQAQHSSSVEVARVRGDMALKTATTDASVNDFVSEMRTVAANMDAERAKIDAERKLAMVSDQRARLGAKKAVADLYAEAYAEVARRSAVRDFKRAHSIFAFRWAKVSREREF